MEIFETIVIAIAILFFGIATNPVQKCGGMRNVE